MKTPIGAVEPVESPVPGGRRSRSAQHRRRRHRIPPPLWDEKIVDRIVAAIEDARRLGPEATVATLLCDSGLKYVNTDVYRRSAG